jgi:hypothetical protein
MIGIGNMTRSYYEEDGYIKFYGEDGVEQSVGAGDNLGHTLAVGDIDNDGKDDLLIAAPWGDGPGNSRNDSGDIYVFFGNYTRFYSTTPGYNQLPDLVDMTIYGADDGDLAGHSLALGDLNNDGFDDIIIGSPYAQGSSNNGERIGEVSVIYGASRSTMNDTYDLNVGTSYPHANYTVVGTTEMGAFGDELLCADLDNDGYDDLFIGEPWGDGPTAVERETGRVYIKWGEANRWVGTGSCSFEMPDQVYGNTMKDMFGDKMEKGDFDGDGATDVVISSYLGDGPDTDAKFNSGDVYLIWGGGRITGSNNDIGDIRDVVFYGKDDSDQCGWAVAMGDMDNDGKDDLAIGSPWGDGPGEEMTDIGEVDLIWGVDKGTIASEVKIAEYDHLVILGIYPYDLFGSSVFMKDLDNDNLADLAVSSIENDGLYDNLTDTGCISLIRGSASLKTVNELSVLDDDNIVTLCGWQEGELFGYSLSAWDLNYDSKPDLAASSKWFNGENGDEYHVGKFQVFPGISPSTTVNKGLNVQGLHDINGTDTILPGTPVSFMVNVTDSTSESNIEKVILRINPFIAADDIILCWDKTLGFYEDSDPNSMVKILNTSVSSIVSSELKVDFQVAFGWDYMNISVIDVLSVGSEADLDRWFYDIDMVNEIEFAGDLVVTYNGTEIGPGDWTLAGEDLTFSNTTLVFKGSNVGPVVEDFVPTLVTPDGNRTVDGTFSPGDEVDITIALGLNETTDYAMSLLAFTDDANLSSVVAPQFDFSVKVDNATPLMTSGLICKPDNDTEGYIDNDNEVFIAWATGSDSGCGVSDYILSYDTDEIRTSETWAEIDGLTEGDVVITVAAMDNLQQVGLSDFVIVTVDMTPVEIVIDSPANSTEFNVTDVNVNATITDLLTGVDGASIQYRVSSNGAGAYSDWMDFDPVADNSSIKVGLTVSFPEGEENYIQWKAADLAGNEMMSEHLNVIIELPVINDPPIPKIASPEVGEELYIGIIEFDATGTTDPENDNLTYIWYVDDDMVGTGITLEYNFTTAGNYTIGLKVNDGNGNGVLLYLSVEIKQPYTPPPVDDDDDTEDGLNPMFIVIPLIVLLLIIVIVIIVIVMVMKKKKAKAKEDEEMQKKLADEKAGWEEEKRKEEVAKADPEAFMQDYEKEKDEAYIQPEAQVEAPAEQPALPEQQEQLPPGPETPPAEEAVPEAGEPSTATPEATQPETAPETAPVEETPLETTEQVAETSETPELQELEKTD